MADPVDVLEFNPQPAGTVLDSGGRRLDIIATVDPGGQTGPTTYYRMRARDVNAVELTYRYWTVTGAPDETAALYTGTYSGGSLNFSDITVIETYDYQPIVG